MRLGVYVCEGEAQLWSKGEEASAKYGIVYRLSSNFVTFSNISVSEQVRNKGGRILKCQYFGLYGI